MKLKHKSHARPDLSDLQQIGWRELVALPDLGIAEMKAKIDTGARTSALHAVEVERFQRNGEEWASFVVPRTGLCCRDRRCGPDRCIGYRLCRLRRCTPSRLLCRETDVGNRLGRHACIERARNNFLNRGEWGSRFKTVLHARRVYRNVLRRRTAFQTVEPLTLQIVDSRFGSGDSLLIELENRCGSRKPGSSSGQ